MKNISTLVFDLETIPSEEKPTPEDIKVPANYKKPESIEAYRNDPEVLDAAWKSQSLDPAVGRILSIAWILDDEPVRSLVNEDEKQLMMDFQEQLQEQFRARFLGQDHMAHPTLIAHNARKFDVSYLWLRIIKYDCEWLLRVVGSDINEIRYKDTMMVMGVLNGFGHSYVSLKKACKLFGFTAKKDDIDGSMVFAYWQAGRLEEIRKYCENDTIACYNLARKLKLIL